MQLKNFEKQMKANSSQWQEIIEIRVEMDEIETKKISKSENQISSFGLLLLDTTSLQLKTEVNHEGDFIFNSISQKINKNIILK